MQLIKEIIVPDESYNFIDIDDSSKNIISNLSKINIFVGENNSGKSRLLRYLLKTELNYMPCSFSIKDLNEVIENIKTKMLTYFSENSTIPINEINNLNSVEYINNSITIREQLIQLKSNIEIIIQRIDSYQPYISNGLTKIYTNEASIFDENLDILILPEFQKIYIPILRGMRPVNFSDDTFQNEDIYTRRTQFDYFKEFENDFEIFAGLTAFETIKNHTLGTYSERKILKEYEKYLSVNFFEGKYIKLIPSGETGDLTIKIGDEKEYPIYHLGDGIQSIIIITLPLFFNQNDNLLVFIEEPEQLLHPGLQRKLLKSLLEQDRFEKYQYFFTTHSNHFLDITFDLSGISVYAIKKILPNVIENEKIPNFSIENLYNEDRSSLELLGVRNSSVFLSNCTIWVEGITDRLYFRHYLDLFEKFKKNEDESFFEFKEDFHYSFVEYGGNNITHWSFLDKEDAPIKVDRLCGRLFLISDKDEKKEERHEYLKTVLKDRYYQLKCREVENLLSKGVLLKTITDYEGNHPEIEDFKESDYKNELLGKFIEEKLGTNKRRQGSYRMSSGTISDKGGFCNKAIRNTNSWDDLSNETKEICHKIYEFIKENNN